MFQEHHLVEVIGVGAGTNQFMRLREQFRVGTSKGPHVLPGVAIMTVSDANAVDI